MMILSDEQIVNIKEDVKNDCDWLTISNTCRPTDKSCDETIASGACLVFNRAIRRAQQGD